MQGEEEFLEQFNKVFDNNNQIKLCGRLECIKLITIANNIETNVNHGNVNTGIINIDNMLKLRDRCIN